jgi:hypothetical protein
MLVELKLPELMQKCLTAGLIVIDKEDQNKILAEVMNIIGEVEGKDISLLMI